jgi:hypothetical protein
MKYLVMTMIATLITAAIAPFILQFSAWGAKWLRQKQDGMTEDGQEKEKAPVGPEETE